MVDCGSKKIFHTGDTIFHGCWWQITNRFGPIAIAFLSINEMIVDIPLLQPASPLEAVMTPEQMAISAKILKALSIVPIHYGSLRKPPNYTETPDVMECLLKNLNEMHIHAIIKKLGEWFELG